MGESACLWRQGTAILNVTHDAHFIPEGVPHSGRLAGFNNKGVSATQSSADEIELPRVGYNYTITTGQAFLPSTYSKRHACSGYTSNMGSTQQLPNGNQLICIALSGKIYEYFIGRDATAISELGAYFTDRHITTWIFKNLCSAKPNPDGTLPIMIDLFGGSGGFTTGFIMFMIQCAKEMGITIPWETELHKIYHYDI
ncbi:MAG: hypothetical protein FGM54_08910, partial [Chitinophagaceae bacterium]|nr:hypothetical protein [Chitinophagaceae bacterium]